MVTTLSCKPFIFNDFQQFWFDDISCQIYDTVMDKKKPIGINLTEKDRRKVDVLAKAEGVSRSEMVRNLIRSRRLPKQPKQPRRQVFLSGALIE